MILDRLAPPRAGVILDVDCGGGFPILEIAQRCSAACRIIAIDLWADVLRRAEERRRFHGIAHVLIARADASRLPIVSGGVDLIVMNLGINNYADPPAVLRECARAARPGGRMVMTTNARGCFAEFYEAYRELLTERNMPESLGRLAANVEHRGSRQSLTEALEKEGFALRNAAEETLTMCFADASAMMRHALVRLGFLDGWRAVVPPDQADEILGELERRLNAQAARERELRMTTPMLYLEAVRA
jgi:ubiquinone/menaquinone biosynthesis C-methylase UbiE